MPPENKIKHTLEFATEIPHHEGGGNVVEVSVERRNSVETPVMRLETYEGYITLSLDEIVTLHSIGSRFVDAENKLKEFE